MRMNLGGAAVKQRRPAGVLLLSILTLGIYGAFWYYAINRELRDLGEDVSPGVALLAVTLGAVLVVPPFVSWYRTGARLRRLERSVGVRDTISGGFTLTMALLSVLVVPAVILIVAVQRHANRLYDAIARYPRT